jgi:hypothetical protein
MTFMESGLLAVSEEFHKQKKRGQFRVNSAMQTLGRMTAWSVGWAWFVIAGIGGLALLIHQGPLPVTNGWFAMFSGIAGCPLTASLLKKYAGISVSGWVQFVLALLIFIVGRIAVVLVLHRPFLPQ